MVDSVDCTVVDFVEPWENDFEKWIVHGVRQGFCSPIYCENHDGHLGWTCPVSTFEGFEASLDLDHLDGDHHNNTPSNVKTYCKLCHGRKSLINGDCNSNKASTRRMV